MIELSGAVTITINGESARVVGEQRRIHVDLENPRAFIRSCGAGTGSGAGSGGSPLDALRQAAAMLNPAGLTVRVTSHDSHIVTLGREARPGLFGGLLGSPYVAPGSPRGLLRLLGS